MERERSRGLRPGLESNVTPVATLRILLNPGGIESWRNRARAPGGGQGTRPISVNLMIASQEHVRICCGHGI
jgi:hypothetical protein